MKLLYPKWLIAHGLCPMPVSDSITKRPTIKGWTSFLTFPSDNEIIAWRGKAIGIVCGKISGNLEVIDFDEKHRLGIYETWKASLNEEELACLSRCVISSTVNKGFHVIYRYEGVEGNEKLASSVEKETLIETRGQGGYVLEPPNKGYAKMQGWLDTIPMLTEKEREAFFEKAIALNEYTPPVYEVKPHQHYQEDTTRPGDLYNQTATFAEILEPLGWKRVGQQKETIYWRRPGKNFGISATENWKGNGLLHVFSKSTSLEAERSYTKFQVYAFLSCDGDFSQAAFQVKKPEKEYEPTDFQIKYEQSVDGAILEKFSSIPMEPIEWLWPGVIAKGKVTLIGGNPGLGKSQIFLSLAASISRGTPFPSSLHVPAIGSAIIISTEDDPKDTIGPRLEANAADRDRVYLLRGILKQKKKNRFILSEECIQILSSSIDAIKDLSAIFVDPIASYLGKVDSNNNAEVRGVLEQLSDMAATKGIAIIALTHLNKNAGNDVMARFMGSMAFVAHARAAFLVTKDPNDELRRLVVPVKNNLAKDTNGFAYRLEAWGVIGTKGEEIITSKVVWETGQIAISANSIMREQKDQNKQMGEKVIEAREFLIATLNEEGTESVEIKQQAEARGISLRTLHRAAQELHIIIIDEKTDTGRKTLWKTPFIRGEY